MSQSQLPRFLRRAGSVITMVSVNLFIFVIVFMCLEITARGYAYFSKGSGFFRSDTFITPWITTYDYPPPMIRDDGKPYFRHRRSATIMAKPQDTIRIIAVGGSTTANESAFELTGSDYSLELEKKASGAIADRTIEVLNAGGDGYSTAQSLINIEFRLIEFNPDFILLMHNINDCSVNFFGDGATSDYSNKYLKHYFLNPSLQGTLSIPGLLSQSRLLTGLGLPQMLANKGGDINSGADFNGGLRFFRRNLGHIAKICDENDIRLVLLSQPYSMESHPFVRQEAVLAYNRAIYDSAEELRIQFVDLFSRFGHENQFFVDPFHFSPQGIDRLSDILLEELIPVIEGLVEEKSPEISDDGPGRRNH